MHQLALTITWGLHNNSKNALSKPSQEGNKDFDRADLPGIEPALRGDESSGGSGAHRLAKIVEEGGGCVEEGAGKVRR